MKSNIFALGRMKAGQRNKTEQAYENYLTLLYKMEKIAWFRFEGIRFRLADSLTYTPDFMIMLPNGLIEAHEIKGSKAIFMDDSKAKIKMAAKDYPFTFKVVFPVKGGGWEEMEI